MFTEYLRLVLRLTSVFSNKRQLYLVLFIVACRGIHDNIYAQTKCMALCVSPPGIASYSQLPSGSFAQAPPVVLRIDNDGAVSQRYAFKIRFFHKSCRMPDSADKKDPNTVCSVDSFFERFIWKQPFDFAPNRFIEPKIALSYAVVNQKRAAKLRYNFRVSISFSLNGGNSDRRTYRQGIFKEAVIVGTNGNSVNTRFNAGAFNEVPTSDVFQH